MAMPLDRLIELAGQLAELGKKMNAQDNRMTAHPIWQVREKRSYWDGGVMRMTPIARAFFFTEDGANDHLAAHGHAYVEPDVYVDSQWRNAEWMKIRAILMELGRDFE